MAQHPHMADVSIRPLQSSPGCWRHDWDGHLHRYHGKATFLLTKPSPGTRGAFPMTLCTSLTLDLCVNDPFAPLHPPLPPPEGDVEVDSDQASPSTSLPEYSPFPKGGSVDNPLVILSDSETPNDNMGTAGNPVVISSDSEMTDDDEGTGLDETMTESESEKEDPEEEEE